MRCGNEELQKRPTAKSNHNSQQLGDGGIRTKGFVGRRTPELIRGTIQGDELFNTISPRPVSRAN
jgi:hypothetical protein